MLSILSGLIFVLGTLTAGFLIFFVGTGIVYFLVRRFETPQVASVEMPVLRPIPIPTRDRSLFMRVVVWLHQVRSWEVAENWEFTLPDGTRIVIHQGFEFDGASIPRPLWAILNPIGLLLIPGLIHDYGYRYRQLWKVGNGTVSAYTKGGSKTTWDRLFRKTGCKVNGMSFVNFVAWLAVYFGGWLAWRSNRRKDEQPVVPKGMVLAAAGVRSSSPKTELDVPIGEPTNTRNEGGGAALPAPRAGSDPG